MAKIKVHELAKELEKQSKEIIAFLQDKGIEAKAAQSSLAEDAAEIVRRHFGKGTADEAGKESAKIKKENMTGKTEEGGVRQAASKMPETQKPAQQSSETQQPAQMAEASRTPEPAPQPESAPLPRKKKKIIFVSNPGNSKMPSGQRPPASTAMRQTAKPAAKPVPKPVPKPAPKTEEKKEVSGVSKEVMTEPKKEAEAVKPVQAAEQTAKTENRAEKVMEPKTETAKESAVQAASAEKKEERVNAPDKQPVNRTDYQGRNNNAGSNANNRGGFQDRNNRNGYQDRGNGANRSNYHDRNDRNDRGDRSGNNNRNGYQNRNNNGGRTQNADRAQGNGRPGFGNSSGGRTNSFFGQGNNRTFGNNDRDRRGAGGQDNKFRKQGASKGFMSEAPIKDTEKHRDEEKRRISQEKDKRSKKDLIYEEDDSAKLNKNKAGRFIKPEKKVEVVEEQIKVITIPESLTIKELADKMKLQPSAIIKKLFLQGQIVTVNSEISFEDAENIAIDYEIICEKEVKVDVIEELLKEDEEAEEDMVSRPPVICVMGHVDHGKTSLLDAIRKTNVTDREAGGITQHIGAYTVSAGGKQITFLDTPGHEAFTAMRMRGANSTDIAILVVAADDGVMPQTIEAINHAKAAGIEIIVAVNKVDKPNANIDRVKQEMTEHELIPVDWGGSTEFVPVSAKSGEGIDTLLETILLTAEIMELKANPNRRARGLVIEAELDKGRGPVATVLVQKGVLHVGDFVSAGASHGKVRAMVDDKGRRVKEAGPSTPVEILGLSDVPSAGEVIIAHENDKTAKSYAETYLSQNKEKMLEETKTKMSLDDLFTQIQAGNLKELNLIVKADVQGSVEAVKQSLVKLSNEEVVVKCIHGGVGAINESDVSLASASSAIIIGFNVRPDATAKTVAEREGVDVRLYKVIYQAIEDVEAAMKGMLDPIFEERVIGHAEVRQIFKASAVGNIAGSYVLDGVFERGCKVRISREGEQIYEGELASLKRFKDDVKEVKAGFECGLVFAGFDQMQELDIVEAYKMVEVPRQ